MAALAARFERCWVQLQTVKARGFSQLVWICPCSGASLVCSAIQRPGGRATRWPQRSHEAGLARAVKRLRDARRVHEPRVAGRPFPNRTGGLRTGVHIGVALVLKNDICWHWSFAMAGRMCTARGMHYPGLPGVRRPPHVRSDLRATNAQSFHEPP